MDPIEALFTWMGVVGMLVAYRGYRTFRIDVLRDRLFAIRDKLFDFARTGEIGFTSPAYGLVRGTINSHIRFAHSSPGLFGALLLYGRMKQLGLLDGKRSTFRTRMESALRNESGAARTLVEGIAHEMDDVISDHLWSGLLPRTLLAIGRVVHGLEHWLRSFRQRGKAVIDECAASVIGSPTRPA